MRRWGRHSYAWRDHKDAKVGCATRMLDATLSPRCHWCAWREPRRWSAKMLRATLSQKGHSQVWRELRRESGTVLTGTGDGSAARMLDRPRSSGEAVVQRQRRQGRAGAFSQTITKMSDVSGKLWDDRTTNTTWSDDQFWHRVRQGNSGGPGRDSRRVGFCRGIPARARQQASRRAVTVLVLMRLKEDTGGG